MKLQRRKKEIQASFAEAPQTTTVIAIVCSKGPVKMEKALSVWVGAKDRKWDLIDWQYVAIVSVEPL